VCVCVCVCILRLRGAHQDRGLAGEGCLQSSLLSRAPKNAAKAAAKAAAPPAPPPPPAGPASPAAGVAAAASTRHQAVNADFLIMVQDALHKVRNHSSFDSILTAGPMNIDATLGAMSGFQATLTLDPLCDPPRTCQCQAVSVRHLLVPA